MTEFEKMRSSQLYNFSDPEIFKSLDHAKKLCARLQTVTITDDCYREMIEDSYPAYRRTAWCARRSTATTATV